MRSIFRLLGQRLALGLLSLFAVSVIIFLAVGMLPGDIAQAMLGQSATPETVAAFRAQLGLDMPPLSRFGHWIWQLLQGDLGVSLANQRPIADLVAAAWATPSAWRCWRRWSRYRWPCSWACSRRCIATVGSTACSTPRP